jgi:hypothetical protein
MQKSKSQSRLERQCQSKEVIPIIKSKSYHN